MNLNAVTAVDLVFLVGKTKTWHKSMLRKEILKCDKNSDTFLEGTKKVHLGGRTFFAEF